MAKLVNGILNGDAWMKSAMDIAEGTAINPADRYRMLTENIRRNIDNRVPGLSSEYLSQAVQCLLRKQGETSAEGKKIYTEWVKIYRK